MRVGSPALFDRMLHAYVLALWEQRMSNYNLDELITRWEHEKVTTEQVIGQVLLLLRSLAERIEELERWRRRQEKGDAQVQHKRS